MSCRKLSLVSLPFLVVPAAADDFFVVHLHTQGDTLIDRRTGHYVDNPSAFTAR